MPTMGQTCSKVRLARFQETNAGKTGANNETAKWSAGLLVFDIKKYIFRKVENSILRFINFGKDGYLPDITK